jgi:hypothetical protein
MNEDSRAGRLRLHRPGGRVAALALVPAALGGCASSPDVETGPRGAVIWGFEADEVGDVPKHWSITETNPTASRATWQVRTDVTAPAGHHVLALTESDNYDGTFNLAIAKRSSFRNLDLTVRVKAVAGDEDQGGGPIWRCRDRNNYYICRVNPLENNFRVYVVADGRRRQLASDRVELIAGRWYEIRVLMQGDEITCWLDGQELLYAADDHFGRAGMVGLWTKADAVTSFDDLVVRPANGD